MANSQSDGRNRIRRMEFEFLGRSYEFLLNPEEYTQPEPARVNVTQTKAGAWIDHFGSGVRNLTMKGTTGFRGTTQDPTTGFEKFKQLRDLIRYHYDHLQPGDDITAGDEMIFHNHTDGEHWIVCPTNFQLFRSVARPLHYMYQIDLILMRPASVPRDSTADVGGIGKIGSLPTIE